MAARSPALVLGIDLSTTSAKAVVMRADGKVVGRGRSAYPNDFRPGGIAEQAAGDWLVAIRAATRQALGRSGGASRVVAMAVASQSITVVPVDAGGSPLRAAISWLDARAEREAAALDQAFPSGAFFRKTGRRPFAIYTLPKWRWLKTHEPELFERTEQWLLPLPFVMRWLTGTAVTDRSIASGSGAYDLTADRWDDELLAWAGVPPRTMPRVDWSGATVGGLTPVAADALGLPAGVPVVLGGQDQKVACFAAGLAPGFAAVSLGTAAAVSAVGDRLVLDPACGMPVSPYVEPGRWVLEGVVMTATSALDWIATTTRQPVGRLLSAAEASGGGAHGVRCEPWFSGAGSPDWIPGAAAAFSGVTLATTPGDLARAVIEGVAREIARNLDAQAQLGVQFDRLLVTGGGTRAKLWLQAIADTANRPVRAIHNPDVVAIGAAIIAGVSTAMWADAAVARSATLPSFVDVEPSA